MIRNESNKIPRDLEPNTRQNSHSSLHIITDYNWLGIDLESNEEKVMYQTVVLNSVSA